MLLGVQTHNPLRDERFKNRLCHGCAEDNALWMKTIVGCELNQGIFLDLNMNDGPRNGSSDSRNDSLAHRWFQRQDYKILLRPESVSLKGKCFLVRGVGRAE